ncbi:MAG: putative endonuclease [Candidatus Azotimanducaceae bacterium]|jgi:putative endonuclease
MTEKKNTTKTGDIGEEIAIKYLVNKGFSVLETKYLKRWGELDIVARNKDVVHFVEVKTFSYETRGKLERSLATDSWRPEEMVHQFKLHQIGKALRTWISENAYKGEYQIDVIAIHMTLSGKYATVEHIEKVVAE